MKNFIFLCFCLLAGNCLSAQDFSLSTNLADYANFGTLNADLSYGVSRHWTVDAGLRYNPFTFGEGDAMKSNRQRSISAGARYWPWHIYSGWWLAGRFRVQEYNLGGIKSPSTTEGNRYGGGVSGGYSFMLGPHFNVDFGVGVWNGYERYVVYQCPVCGKVTGTGEGYFILPNDILLSLTYVF